jgi:hypothetical protein
MLGLLLASTGSFQKATPSPRKTPRKEKEAKPVDSDSDEDFVNRPEHVYERYCLVAY